MNTVGYGPVARLYSDYFGPMMAEVARAALPPLLLSRLASQAAILDLGCGAGHVASFLHEMGFQVSGMDIEQSMIDLATERVPGAQFFVGDAREFEIQRSFDAVISTTDVINHILKVEDLERAFRSVFGALTPGGYFLFDVNSVARYDLADLAGSDIQTPDTHWVVRITYDQREAMGTFQITMTQRDGTSFKQQEFQIFQRIYPTALLGELLDRVGFGEITWFEAAEDLGVEDQIGRYYCRCVRPR